MWKVLMLFGFNFLCVAVPVTPQSIGTHISSAELAKIEQTILEKVRPAIISLTNRVEEEFTQSMEERLQKFLEREISIATSNRVQKLQTAVTSNQHGLMELNDQCRIRINSTYGIMNNISKLGKQVESNKNNIHEISGTLHDLNNEFDRYRQQTSHQREISKATNNEVQKLKTAVKSNQQDLMELKDQCRIGINSTPEIINNISKLQTQIVSNQNNIQEIKGTLHNLSSEFVIHKQQTSLQASQITLLQTKIKSLLKLTCAAGKGSVKDNFCFIFSSDSATWSQARRNCRQRGGYLAIVNSQSITNFLNTMTVPGNDAFWIGGHDQRREGSWIWDQSGQSIKYTNWNKNEPNDAGGEDCITLIKNKQGKWNDLSCNHSRKYICQTALPSV